MARARNLTESGALNLKLNKNQAISPMGRRYIEDVMIGENASYSEAVRQKMDAVEKEQDVRESSARKGQGRAIMVLLEHKDRKTVETVVRRNFPGQAKTLFSAPDYFHCGSKDKSEWVYKDYLPFAEEAHGIINGHDAARNLTINKNATVRIYANTYCGISCVPTTAASTNKIVVIGHIRKGLTKTLDMNHLAAEMTDAVQAAGWPGEVSGILKYGSTLEVTFCYIPEQTKKYRHMHQLVGERIIKALNLWPDMEKAVTFSLAPEDYALLVPGSYDIKTRSIGSLVYLNQNLGRASLREAFANMGYSKEDIKKQKDVYYTSCQNTTIKTAPTVTNLGSAHAQIRSNVLEKIAVMPGRKMGRYQTLDFMAVYASCQFCILGGFAGKTVSAGVFTRCSKLLDQMEASHITVDVLEKSELRKCVAHVQQNGRTYSLSGVISKLKLSEAEAGMLRQADKDAEHWYQSIKIENKRNSSQNKTRNQNLAVRNETTRILRKEAVALFEKGKSYAEISAKIKKENPGARGFSVLNLQRFIPKWKEELETKPEAKTMTMPEDRKSSVEIRREKMEKTRKKWEEDVNDEAALILGDCLAAAPLQGRYALSAEYLGAIFETVMKAVMDAQTAITTGRSPQLSFASSSMCEKSTENLVSPDTVITDFEKICMSDEPFIIEWLCRGTQFTLKTIRDSVMRAIIYNRYNFWKVIAYHDALLWNPPAPKSSAEALTQSFCDTCLPVCKKMENHIWEAVPRFVKELNFAVENESCAIPTGGQLFGSAVGLVYLWTRENYRDAVEAYDMAMQLDAGEEKTACYRPSVYVESEAFTHDFPVGAILEAGVRTLRKALLAEDIPVPFDDYCAWLADVRRDGDSAWGFAAVETMCADRLAECGKCISGFEAEEVGIF